MARPSSSKKIQRAARAAATSRGARERRELGFPIALVLVVVLGVAMVVVARASRAPAVAPQISDHWHSAYGVYDCDRFVEPFLSASDPDGIHSHRDGVIHIHPWNSSATGTDASLKVFFESMGVRVTDDEISGPGIGVLEAGSDCGGEPTIIRVARFGLSAGAGEAVDFDSVGELRDLFEITEEFTDDFGDVRLLADGEAFTIARVPAGAEIPPPPEERLLTAFSASLGNLVSSGPQGDVDPEEAPPVDFVPEETPVPPVDFVPEEAPVPPEAPAPAPADAVPADGETSDGG